AQAQQQDPLGFIEVHHFDAAPVGGNVGTHRIERLLDPSQQIRLSVVAGHPLKSLRLEVSTYDIPTSPKGNPLSDSHFPTGRPGPRPGPGIAPRPLTLRPKGLRPWCGRHRRMAWQ